MLASGIARHARHARVGFTLVELLVIIAIVAMLVFACVGAVAGWIADYLVRQSLEGLFRKRVDWYRQGLIDAGYIEAETPSDD